MEILTTVYLARLPPGPPPLWPKPLRAPHPEATARTVLLGGTPPPLCSGPPPICAQHPGSPSQALRREPIASYWGAARPPLPCLLSASSGLRARPNSYPPSRGPRRPDVNIACLLIGLTHGGRSPMPPSSLQAARPRSCLPGVEPHHLMSPHQGASPPPFSVAPLAVREAPHILT